MHHLVFARRLRPEQVAAIAFYVIKMSNVLMIPSTHALFLCIFAFSCFMRVQHQRKNDRILATTAKVAFVGRFVVAGFGVSYGTVARTDYGRVNPRGESCRSNTQRPKQLLWRERVRDCTRATPTETVSVGQH